jgi:hypothetical protein
MNADRPLAYSLLSFPFDCGPTHCNIPPADSTWGKLCTSLPISINVPHANLLYSTRDIPHAPAVLCIDTSVERQSQ